MMLGRAEVLVAPEKPVEFLEDMPQNVQAAAAMVRRSAFRRRWKK